MADARRGGTAPDPRWRAEGGEAAHQHLATLAQRAERVARSIDVSTSGSFQAQRRRVRQALVADPVGGEIEAAVVVLLA